MNVIIPLLLFLFIAYYFTHIFSHPLGKWVERFSYYGACLFIVFIAAFRNEDVGADTSGYMSDYAEVVEMTFQDIVYEYSSYRLYYYLSKIFTMLHLPLWAWFGFIELVYLSSIVRLINQYSKDRLYSIIIFIASGLLLFSFAGLKQTLAMGFMLHSLLDMMGKKYIRSIILIVAAFFCHPAVLITLFAYPLYGLRHSKSLPVVVIVLAGLLLFAGFITLTYLVDQLGDEHFESYLNIDRSYSRKTLYLYLLMLACTIPFIRAYFKTSDTSRFELACLLLACCFQNLASYSPSLFRLSYLFTPFFLVYLPNAFEARKDKDVIYFFFKQSALLGPVIFQLYAARDFVFTLASY